MESPFSNAELLSMEEKARNMVEFYEYKEFVHPKYKKCTILISGRKTGNIFYKDLWKVLYNVHFVISFSNNNAGSGISYSIDEIKERGLISIYEGRTNIFEFEEAQMRWF